MHFPSPSRGALHGLDPQLQAPYKNIIKVAQTSCTIFHEGVLSTKSLHKKTHSAYSPVYFSFTPLPHSLLIYSRGSKELPALLEVWIPFT